MDQSEPSILRLSPCCCNADTPIPEAPSILLGKDRISTADAIAGGSFAETALLSLVLIVLIKGPGNVMLLGVLCVVIETNF